MLSAAKHPSILAGAKKKKMQRFFNPLRFVQNDRRPGLPHRFMALCLIPSTVTTML
jgi:hypothetical protein